MAPFPYPALSCSRTAVPQVEQSLSLLVAEERGPPGEPYPYRPKSRTTPAVTDDPLKIFLTRSAQGSNTVQPPQQHYASITADAHQDYLPNNPFPIEIGIPMH